MTIRDGKQRISSRLRTLTWFVFSSVAVSNESVNQLQWQNGEWASRIRDGFQDIGTTKIHSIQNGILLSAQIHKAFDTYKVSINPDVFHSCLYSLI